MIVADRRIQKGSDQGISHEISIHYTTSDNSQSNEIIEKFHSTINERVQILREKNHSLIFKEKSPIQSLNTPTLQTEKDQWKYYLDYFIKTHLTSTLQKQL